MVNVQISPPPSSCVYRILEVLELHISIQSTLSKSIDPVLLFLCLLAAGLLLLELDGLLLRLLRLLLLDLWFRLLGSGLELRAAALLDPLAPLGLRDAALFLLARPVLGLLDADGLFLLVEPGFLRLSCASLLPRTGLGLRSSLEK